MARRRSYHRKRRQGRFSFLYKILIFVTICGAIAVALALFFKVDTITVTGNSRYTANQIIEASGIETGDNMFFLNKYHASERITAALPYVETVRISRQLPDTLVVTVTECTAPAAVSQDGKLWLLSGDGKIVDAKTGDGKQYAVVEGLTLLEPQVGAAASGAGGAAALRPPAADTAGSAAGQRHAGGRADHRPQRHRLGGDAVSGQVRRDLPLGRGFRL